MRGLRHNPRGFTLIEMMVAVVIIILLASLTVVAAGSFIRGSRRSAETENLRSEAMAVEQFEQRFKFAVPLVDDFDAAGPIRRRSGAGDHDFKGEYTVRIAGEAETSADDPQPSRLFLSYENPAFPETDARYSELSVPYYVLGVLAKEVDGVDGPGLTTPYSVPRAGPPWRSFAKGGSTIAPLMDVGDDRTRLRAQDASGAEVVGPIAERDSRLLDRWGKAQRYYRWEPLLHSTVNPPPGVGRAAAPANVSAQAGEVRDFNVPYFLGDPRQNPTLRAAVWALVSAGPDGQINEANPVDKSNADNISVVKGGSTIEGSGS